MTGDLDTSDAIWQKRPEQLGVPDFVKLTRLLEHST
jgi:hypothetical protein